ncbi:MAG: hypothetical protein ABI083_16315 [Lapillicoccus sp.]
MLWSSTVAYVLAQSLVILLHESSHSVAGLLLGYNATQFTGEVRFNPDPTTNGQIVTAATGPLFSLATGLLAIAFRPVRRGGFAAMLWVWFAFLSAEEGIGYFVIAPFISAGDTGAALAAMKAPGWVAWACLAFGAAGVFLLARRFAVDAVRWTRDLYEIRAFCVWAWLIGSGVSVAIEVFYLALTPGTTGDAVFAIVLGSASLGVFAPMAMIFWEKIRVEKQSMTLRFPTVGIVVLVALVIVKALVFTRGLHLG